MTDARSQILTRIRQARNNSGHVPKAYEAIERHYLQGTPPDQHAMLALFEDRLQDYGATVWRCSMEGLPQAIASAAAFRNKTKLLIAPTFPHEWLPESLSFTADQQLAYEAIDRIGSVLTTCALAIAETGTIVLRHDKQEGRRALSLIPDYHLCIVQASQIVASVVEGIRYCAGFGPVPLTTISGPSATSDIEMTRIKGVHGPRTLDVILINQTLADRTGQAHDDVRQF